MLDRIPGLDEYITGHYGEDQFQQCRECKWGPDCTLEGECLFEDRGEEAASVCSLQRVGKGMVERRLSMAEKHLSTVENPLLLVETTICLVVIIFIYSLNTNPDLYYI